MKGRANPIVDVGDIVRRAPDGPTMTVESWDDGHITCVWFGVNSHGRWTGPHRRRFRHGEIEKVSQTGRQ